MKHEEQGIGRTLDEVFEQIDKIIKESTRPWMYKKGHDYGAAYWVCPVIVKMSDKITDQDIRELPGEISIELSFFNEYLEPIFVEALDNAYAPNTLYLCF